MLRNPWLHRAVTVTDVGVVTNMVSNVQGTLDGLPNLTADDKLICIKVGDPQAEFMHDIHKICILKPKVMPAWHDINDFYSRIGTMNNLMEIQSQLMGLLEMVDNALIGAKHDSMVFCLDYYHSLKRAKQSGMPGLHKHYVKVRDHFKTGTGVTPEEQYPENEDSGSDDNATDGNGSNNTGTATDGKTAA